MLARMVTRRGLFTRLAYRFSEEEEGGDKKMEGPENVREDKKTELHRRFSGEVKIEQKFHGMTSALYDRYMQVRERPLVCHDGYNLSYEFIIERVPIFAPYHPKNFEAFRNRYVYAKKTGFYVPIPNQLKLDEGDNPFQNYDETNEENAISHQIVLSQTQKISYRENSKVWRHTDPNIIDPHSIQTYSSNNVYLIVKEKGKWKFPTKLINQKDTHSKVFEYMTQHLFQGLKYPSVHYPTKKPMGIRKVHPEGAQKPMRIFTFRGLSAYGIPKFPTSVYEDFAWVPKPLLSEYFEDEYFEKSIWAVTHNFY